MRRPEGHPVVAATMDWVMRPLETLRERPEPPDHVVVELSGVADPARVVPFAGTAGFSLDGVVAP